MWIDAWQTIHIKWQDFSSLKNKENTLKMLSAADVIGALKKAKKDRL